MIGITSWLVRFCIFLPLICISHNLYSASTAVLVKDRFQQLNETYQDKIEALYNSIGVKVRWIDMPIKRSHNEALRGNIDGILFSPCRPNETSDPILCLTDFVVDVSIFLVCRKKLICDESVLHQDNNYIAGPSVATGYLLSKGYSARLHQIEKIEDADNLLIEDRFDYALMLGQERPFSQHYTKLNYLPLGSLSMYHAIAPHRRDWYEQISHSLSLQQTKTVK